MFIVTEAVARYVVKFPDVIAAVSQAFEAYDMGKSAVFDVARGNGTDPSHFLAIKSGRDGSVPRLGLKAGSYCPANKSRGLNLHTSTVLLIDDETGAAHALVSCNHLNGMRTAAADALAVTHLARADANTLGVIGPGHQAVYDVEAIHTVRPIKRLLVAGRSKHRLDQFTIAVERTIGLSVEIATIEQVARNADILVTTTASVTPLVLRQWIRPGTHISAMGADSIGKQELAIDLVAAAEVYVDIPQQAQTIGECQHAYKAGLITEDRIDSYTLGGLITGRIPGRQNAESITLFDSSGMALQDIAVANLATDRAAQLGAALKIDMSA